MTQCETILKHMQEHGSISTMEAFSEYLITRLSARIWDLRHDGYDIVSDKVTKKTADGTSKSYAVYTLNETLNVTLNVTLNEREETNGCKERNEDND